MVENIQLEKKIKQLNYKYFESFLKAKIIILSYIKKEKLLFFQKLNFEVIAVLS